MSPRLIPWFSFTLFERDPGGLPLLGWPPFVLDSGGTLGTWHNTTKPGRLPAERIGICPNERRPCGLKKLPVSSRGWVLIGLTSLILMFGALYSYNKSKTTTYPISSGGTTGGDVPLNTLNGDNPPPMPDGGGGVTSGGGTSGGGTFTSGGGTFTTGGGSSGGTGSLPPDSFEPPPQPRDNPPPVAQNDPAQQPVVWVSEEGATAYSQPGFNMPKVRELKRWEELKIVESSQENWDKVRDLEGAEFWVQKKVVTIIRPQNLNQPSIAEKTVMNFFTAVAQTRHSDAYVYLSPEWKRELSYDRFVTGYSRTDSLRSEIVNIFKFEGERFQVDVAQEAIEEGEPVDYLGIYTVEKLDGQWYLTSGSLKRQARSL